MLINVYRVQNPKQIVNLDHIFVYSKIGLLIQDSVSLYIKKKQIIKQLKIIKNQKFNSHLNSNKIYIALKNNLIKSII